MDYNPRLPKISTVLIKRHKAMIFKKPELKDVFKDAPMAALRQPPNLRSMICRATLFQPRRGERLGRKTHNTAPGWKKCGKGSTTCCPFSLPSTQTVVGQVTGYSHQITDPVTCQTENCVYYWKCMKSNCKLFPKCE